MSKILQSLPKVLVIKISELCTKNIGNQAHFTDEKAVTLIFKVNPKEGFSCVNYGILVFSF